MVTYNRSKYLQKTVGPTNAILYQHRLTPNCDIMDGINFIHNPVLKPKDVAGQERYSTYHMKGLYRVEVILGFQPPD